MGMIEEVATYLDGQSTKIALGTTLTINYLPSTIGTLCAAVYETPGAPPVDRFGPDALPAVTRPRVQVVCRSTGPAGGPAASPVNARSLAQDLWEAASKVTNETLTSVTYLRLQPLQDPFLLRRDEAGRAVFAFNMQVWRPATTNG